MRLHRLDLRLLLLAWWLPFVGCANERDPQPPTVQLGQQECDVCHMIISDERYTAALAMVDDRGRFSSLVFDDIGCLLEHEADHPELNIAARYVRDARTAQWLDAERAAYLHSHSLQTPMAYRVAATAMREEAVAMQSEHPGELLRLDEVRARFLAGALRMLEDMEGVDDDQHP